MVYDHLTNYLPRSFLREYRETNWFAYSSPVSSFFWILSAILRTDRVPFLDAADLYRLLVSLAILSIVAPVTIYYFKNRPFHVLISWIPVEAEPIDLRLKNKGLFRIRDDDQESSSPPIIIIFYFDKSVTSYKLMFGSQGPLDVRPANEPKNADYDETSGILECDSIEDHHFYVPLRVEELEENRGELERNVYIKDLTSGRDTELLRIQVL